jgi:hypothetical protein
MSGRYEMGIVWFSGIRCHCFDVRRRASAVFASSSRDAFTLIIAANNVMQIVPISFTRGDIPLVM